MSDRVEEPGWDAGWDGHSLAQQRRMAELTLIEKIEWLEQAQRMTEQMKKPPASERPDIPPDVSA